MYDLMIVGGGPAALAAACSAEEKQLNVVMVYEDLGGKVGWRESLVDPDLDQRRGSAGRQQLQQAMPYTPRASTYLPANDLVRLLISRVMHSGRVIHDRVLTISAGWSCFSVEMQEQGMVQATAVLIATGATPLRLDVPGADRLIDPGMSYSIATYAQQVAGQRVAVIAGSMRALWGAVELVWTAEQVDLVVPNVADLTHPLIHRLCHTSNVTIFPGYDVAAVRGRQTIEEVVLVRAGQTVTRQVQHAFVDLGLVPNSALVRHLVAVDAHGCIVVDRHHATSVRGLFAAGDVSTMAGEQVMVAIGDGARAAISAHTYILTRRLGAERMICAE